MQQDQIVLITCVWPSLQPTTPLKVDGNSQMVKPVMQYPHLRMMTAGSVNASNSITALGTCTSVDKKPSFVSTGLTMRRKLAKHTGPN